MRTPELFAILRRLVRFLPLFWLNLSASSKLVLIVFAYIAGIAGLWFIFPPTRNGSSMFLPIIIACWLFRYRGLLISLVLNGLVFQVIYLVHLKGLLPDNAFMEGAIIGFVTSSGVGLVVCWLRTAVDQVQIIERERLLILDRERQNILAYEQQRKINLLKDQFLLNVSHELRTPLTVLGTSLELFAEMHEALGVDKRAQLLREAMASQDELVALVSRVLDAVQLTTDIPLAHLEVVDIQQVIQEVLVQLRRDIQGYTLQLHVSEQILVWADRQFLRQIIRNLLSNICKYVPPQTEICIEATQTNPHAPVCLSVQDAGPGIPAEELPLLFEKFVRLKRDLTGSTRGMGLGLYICKQLVEAMGGTIWVESSGHAGKGSRFCLILSPP